MLASDPRREGEEQRHQQGQGERENQHGAIDANLPGSGAKARGERGEHPYSTERDHEPECRSGEGEHQVLHQQELSQAPGPCAECGAHRHLVLAPQAAHEREIRDVRAGDHQDEGRGAHEQPERELGVAAEHLPERRDGHGVA